MNPTFTLYHANWSLCSQMVRVALSEKGIPYGAAHIRLCDQYDEADNLSPWFLEINPTGVVPVLKIDDEIVRDSSYIIERLDEYTGTNDIRLWPKEISQRNQLREWLYATGMPDDAPMGKSLGTAIPIFSSSILAYMIKKLRFSSILKIILKHPRRERAYLFAAIYFTPLAKAMPKTAFEGFAKGLVELEHALSSEDDYLIGDFSHADINLMCDFHRLVDLKLDAVLKMPELPKVAKYWQRLKSRPSYKTAILDFQGEREAAVISEVFGSTESHFSEGLKQKIRKKIRETAESSP